MSGGSIEPYHSRENDHKPSSSFGDECSTPECFLFPFFDVSIVFLVIFSTVFFFFLQVLIITHELVSSVFNAIKDFLLLRLLNIHLFLS